MSQQSSVLSVKPSGTTAFLDVPIIRGKSAYEHALDGGLDLEEQEFNELLANQYKIVISNTPPSTGVSDRVITIVLGD